MRPTLILVLAAAAAACADGGGSAPAGLSTAGAERAGYEVDFSREADVEAGGVAEWAAGRGYTRVIGNPVYFFLRNGLLHLVAQPGPVHDRRVILALTDREKLRLGLESKVLLRLTPDDFALDPAKFPRLVFEMAPVVLPGEGADLRDPDRNDACFHLLVGFGEPVHEFSGVRLPDTVGYVWADQPWEEETASDPDYEKFLRYVAVGHGAEDPGRLRTIRRDLRADYRRLFGDEREGTDLPPVRSIALMIDANTVETKAESVLRSIRILPPAD